MEVEVGVEAEAEVEAEVEAAVEEERSGRGVRDPKAGLRTIDSVSSVFTDLGRRGLITRPLDRLLTTPLDRAGGLLRTVHRPASRARSEQIEDGWTGGGNWVSATHACAPLPGCVLLLLLVVLLLLLLFAAAWAISPQPRAWLWCRFNNQRPPRPQ